MSTFKAFKKKPTHKANKKSISSQEEQDRIKLFRNLQNSSDESLHSELLDFAERGNVERRTFIQRIDELEPASAKIYMRMYLSQKPKNFNTEQMLQKFLNEYASGYDPKQEEQDRREFFERVVNIDDKDEFIDQLDIFAMSNNAPASRADFIDNIRTTMGKALTQKFMTEFLNQRGLRSDTYLREFIKREDVKTNKFFTKNPDQIEKIDKVLEQEPTLVELYANIDFDTELDDDDIPGGIIEADDNDDYLRGPARRVPSWWQDGKVVEKSESESKDRFWKIYTRPECPWCKKAKDLLTQHREKFINFNIDDSNLGKAAFDKIKPLIGNHSTVPIVFLDNKFIGGYTDLENIILQKPSKKRVEIYESFEGAVEEPTAFIPEVVRPLPVTKTPGITFDPVCYNAQVTAPWIKQGRVKHIWLTSPDGVPMNMDYVIKTDTIHGESGVVFYKAGRSFYQLQCNYNSNSRRQNGYTLTSYDSDGKPVKYIVVYELYDKPDDRKWLYQDEAIFKDQVDYFKRDVINVVARVNQIREEVVAEDIRDAGRTQLERAFSREGATLDMNYINRLEAAIYENHKTVGEYVNSVAAITVFLKQWNNSVFKDRIKAFYYQPEVLVKLSIEEKLPEVFDNPNINAEDITKSNDSINNMIKREGNDIIRYVARIRFPGKSQPLPQMTQWFPVSTSNVPGCVKTLQQHDIDPINIIYYTDTDRKTYCFDIFDLKKEFATGNRINPYTNNIFSDAFIQRVNNFDPYTVSITEIDEDKPLDMYRKPMSILAPGFLSKIIDDIERMEKIMVKDVEADMVLADLEGNTFDTSSICEYCTKYIKKGGYKTIIRRDGEYELVRFCNTKCFEGVEEWEMDKEPPRPTSPTVPSTPLGEQVVSVQVTKKDKDGSEYVVTQFKKRKDVLPGEMIIGEQSLGDTSHSPPPEEMELDIDATVSVISEKPPPTVVTQQDALTDVQTDVVSAAELQSEGNIFNELFETESFKSRDDDANSTSSTK